MIFDVATRLARKLEPETAHNLALKAMRTLPYSPLRAADRRLAIRLGNLEFAHPVLLAAGFDKDAVAAHAMGRFGFAGVEVGTLTPLPQAGNPRPRLFRLPEDAAVINRMGFNNGGQAAALSRLSRLHQQPDRPLVGVNIGANKESADRIADYVAGYRTMAPVADWLTVNISSPNTPGLRALQDEGALDALLSAVAEQRTPDGPPVFLKVAPDLDNEQIDGVVRACAGHDINAIIIGNTTISRPPLRSRHSKEAGGLSGAPLKALALQKLREFRRATGGNIPLIAAGGIASADDVWDRLTAGASMIQLYSALAYAGPGLAARIVSGLTDRLDREGLPNLSAIVGRTCG